MKPSRRTRLSVLQLETRWCPSLTVSLASGYLMVSGVPNGTLTIQETGTHLFRVMDGTANLGSYSASNINIKLAHRPGDLNVLLNASGLGGNLFMDLGTGFTGPSGTIHVGGGKIGGTLTGVHGNGNETYDLGFNSVGATDPLTVASSVTISAPTSAGVGAGPPRDHLFLQTGSAVGSDLGTTNVDSVFLAPGSSVGRNVSVSNSLEHTTPDTFLEGSIGQDVSISGPATGISVDLGSLAAATVVRNLSISTLGGNSVVTLAAGSSVGGTATITTGAGNDFVEMGGQVNGSATVSTGDGNDTFSLDAGAAVAGNFNLTTGNGNDTLTVDGSVSGAMVFTLGNGDNTVTVGNAPGGGLHWTSGNGNDSVTFGDATNAAGEFWNVNMRFGTGNDTLTLAGNGTVASPEQLSGFIDMGGPPGGNSFDPTGSLAAGTWVIVPPFTLQNV
jgi:hypothetical protein